LEKDSDIVSILRTVPISRRDISISLKYKNIRTSTSDRELLRTVLLDRWSSFCFKKMYRLHLLDDLMPEVVRLSQIPQTKRGLNVLEHTFRVMNEADKLMSSVEYVDEIKIAFRFAALYHDVGKFETFQEENNKMKFYDHENISAVCAAQFIDHYHLVDSQTKIIICRIIRNHMAPLQYQRKPDWTLGAIGNFVRRCKNDYRLVVEFAKCDKLASSHNKSYLISLEEFMNKCEEVENEQKY